MDLGANLLRLCVRRVLLVPNRGGKCALFVLSQRSSPSIWRTPYVMRRDDAITVAGVIV
jgi:hypothetical protein